MFDERRVELWVAYTREGELFFVDLYKIGGGVFGRPHKGSWAVRILDATSNELLLTTTIRTDTPHTHDQIPALAVDQLDWETE